MKEGTHIWDAKNHTWGIAIRIVEPEESQQKENALLHTGVPIKMPFILPPLKMICPHGMMWVDDERAE